MVYIFVVFTLVIGVFLGYVLRGKAANEIKSEVSKVISETVSKASDLSSSNIKVVSDQLLQSQTVLTNVSEHVDASQAIFLKSMGELEQRVLKQLLDNQTDSVRTQNEMFSSFRSDVSSRIEKLSDTNSKQLAEMRDVVDSRLQKSLDQKLQASFNAVVDQLNAVQKELGAMQALATDVGGLKRVLSNVKTRGILGEIQLGSILSEILSRSQYDENVVTVKGSRNPVEYAVKLPGQNDGEFVYLPIDSKFPLDTYQTLLDAYDSVDSDKSSVTSAWKQLEQRLKQEAKDIHEKYVHVPETTEFAILFLPTEGLYAEAVRRGMVEVLQNEYRVMIAGPTTMAALLNSLQMGFRTLEIQKSSADVWHVLSNVRSEFSKFADALEATQRRIHQAEEDLEKMVGVRTRMMNRQLNKVVEPGNVDKLVLLDE